MIESILRQQADDYKSVPVKDYIAMRKQHFPGLEEDFSLLRQFDTIVVLALSFPDDKPPSKGKGYGYISRYAHGRDYHLVFGEKLRTIEKELEKTGVRAHGSSDISPIDERFAAFLSGMGFLGHNRFLIHPAYGTHLYLATLLIDRPLVIPKNVLDSCGDCTKCIRACPTDALEVGTFHIDRCLSHITQEKKALTLSEIEKIHYLFGCDICQDVCPKNKRINPVERAVFKSDDAAQIHLETLLSKSNGELKKRYKDYAFAWRGMTILKRNAAALLLNQRLYQSRPLIEQAASTYRHVPYFRRTAETIIAEMRKKS